MTTATLTPATGRAAPPRVRRWMRFNPAYLYVAPSLLLIGVFIAEPIVRSGWMSLHDWTVGEQTHTWVGLGNYRELLGDERFRNSLMVTGLYTVVVTTGQVLGGLALALWLRRTTWLTSLLRSAFFFPTIASFAVVGVVWKFLLDPQVGLVNAWLEAAGLTGPGWLTDTKLALPTVMAVGVWKGVGFAMIVLLAAVQGVPHTLIEAATLDGAGRWQRLRAVVLPELRPALLFTTVISTVTSLQLFDLVYVMTGGGPLFHTESIVAYLYQRGFVEFRLGYASAIAWVLFLLILAVSLVQLRIARHDDDDQ
ncbi:carbohydrate ABC transporter permease [Dactylosporangium sucinum]|uniref:Sugar ABC transporter permease n=1 Tax=Dactylosporangium sucinum TaxID=1424081 RepID=A0A917SY24_9ACTN|nr:sugar ABC transporter permease [Dactylosporangium sucinum]GGM03183.1 sugar ABC transporter permease [Dactylosporangium sucinum]